MTTTARWNLVVSRDTDNALRQFLASQDGGRKGDLSRFVEEALRTRILELAAEQAKEQNANISPEAIEEALIRARQS